MTYRGGAASNWSFTSNLRLIAFTLQRPLRFFMVPPQFGASISNGEGDVLALTTFLIVLMLAFDVAECLVAVSLSLLMATVALAVRLSARAFA